MDTPETTSRVRDLNDELSRHSRSGQTVVTRGIAALDETTIQEVLHAVAAFDAFTEDNDPYGEHDCAILTVLGQRIMWKIDYYDTTLTAASPDPSDPSVTRRVLTVMLAEEY